MHKDDGEFKPKAEITSACFFRENYETVTTDFYLPIGSHPSILPSILLIDIKEEGVNLQIFESNTLSFSWMTLLFIWAEKATQPIV